MIHKTIAFTHVPSNVIIYLENKPRGCNKCNSSSVWTVAYKDYTRRYIMRKTMRKGIALGLSLGLAVASLSGCQGSGRTADGKVKLSFQIWDNAQRAGMQAIVDAYMAQNPNVAIEVQVTSWDEYWTKLDAAAESNQLPDIFWMHTNQILKYADYGMLAEVTNLYDDVDPD